MNRRLLFLPTATLSAAVLLAACGGTAATNAPGAPSVAIPSIAIPSIAIPSIAIPSIAIPSIAIPSIGSFAIPSIPSFAPDTTLQAKFPATIEGKAPTSPVETALFIDFLRGFQTPDAQVQQVAAAMQSAGIDFTTLSFGIATYSVGGSTVQLSALRTPNQDAGKIVQNYGILQSISNASNPPPQISSGSYGGKNVAVATDSSGSKTILYVTGDTVFSVTGVTDAQANTIFAALP